MALREPKVVIVGGSIAGLSLALMLEKNGIDFVVLEAYPEIAPQVGASIGVLPNGLRILDQLGCYESVCEAAEYPVDEVNFRDSRGEKFWVLEDFNETIVRKFTYPFFFLDRRMLIEILYNNIEDKSKILTSERVITIENHPEYASVKTQSGKSFKGTFVVGADGIHSSVRKQMWQEAQKSDPEWFDPSEAEALPATYACIFGISTGVSGIERGSLSSVFNQHFSYLIASGPDDRSYWFLVTNMGKKLHGSDIPRFSKKEEEEFVKQHLDDQITPTIRFSEIYKRRVSSVYTPLPEYVYKRWYFQRTMTIGDAAHKFEPLTGQGGNNAIETAAALTNHLMSALKDSTKPLTTAELSEIFAKTQRQREGRVSRLVESSHARQRLECMETPLLRFIGKYVFPYIPKSVIMDRWIETYSAAVSLNMFPVPRTSGEIPYYDELLRAPTPRGIAGYVLYLVYIFMAILASKLLLGAIQSNGTAALLHQSLASHSITEMDLTLRQSFTGLLSIDKMTSMLVTIFLPAITNTSVPEQPLQLMYFLSCMLPLISIFTVEGYREKSRFTLLASPSLWAVVYQLRGIGFVAPIYFAASLFVSRSPTFLLREGRDVPAAKFLLPGVLIGYVIPTMLLFFPFSECNVLQAVIAFWQSAPILVVFAMETISRAWGIFNRSNNHKHITAAKRKSDRLYLSTLYQSTGAIAATVHISIIVGCLISGQLSLSRMFIPTDPFSPKSTLAEGVFVFFQYDFLLMTAATLLWCLVSTWDLYRAGLTDLNSQIMCCALAAGFIVVGPGATAAMVWLYREKAMGRIKD